MQHSKSIRYFYLLTVAILMLGWASMVSAQEEDENRVSVKASIVPAKVQPGTVAQLNLLLVLADGAHANSNDVADPNLIPTVFLPKQATGVSWGQVNYPQPSQVNEWYSNDPLSVFANGAEIKVPLIIEKTATPGQLIVEGTLRIQVCDSEKCYPVRRVHVKVAISISGDARAYRNDSVVSPVSDTKSTTDPIAKTNPVEGLSKLGSAIDFSFFDFNGKERKLSEFRGKFVLLDFWATWCKPCLADIPKLKTLYEKYKSSGFEIIGMDTETIGDEAEAPDPEFVKETTERAKQIVLTRGVAWPQANNDSATPVAIKVFGVKALPTKILIDKEGRIIATIGENDDLTGIVEKLISEKK